MKFTPYITVGFSHGYGGEFSTSISMGCANLSEAAAQEVRTELSKLVERFDDFRRQHPQRPRGPNVINLAERFVCQDCNNTGCVTCQGEL